MRARVLYSSATFFRRNANDGHWIVVSYAAHSVVQMSMRMRIQVQCIDQRQSTSFITFKL